MRISFVGELGWELHASNNAAEDVYDAILKIGKEFGVRNSGYRALDSLSMEKGKSDSSCVLWSGCSLLTGLHDSR